MKFHRILALILALSAIALAGCKAATQTIPVSTNPSGALVYADGTESCTTPCSVELDKTQAHILTLQKQGYNQADVQIRQQYDTAGQTRNAVQSGMWQKSVGGSDEGAIANALMGSEVAEEDGSAYVLTPSSVVVNMVPQNQARQVSQAADPNAPIVINSDQLAPEDQKRLTIDSSQLAPEDQARIHTTEPATIGSAVEEDPAKAAEDVLENAAIAAPSVGTKKEWKHSSSKDHFNNDGSYSRSSTSTSASVGVSVNPVEAGLGVLHLLEDAEGKEKSQQPDEE